MKMRPSSSVASFRLMATERVTSCALALLAKSIEAATATARAFTNRIRRPPERVFVRGTVGLRPYDEPTLATKYRRQLSTDASCYAAGGDTSKCSREHNRRPREDEGLARAEWRVLRGRRRHPPPGRHFPARIPRPGRARDRLVLPSCLGLSPPGGARAPDAHRAEPGRAGNGARDG